MIKIPNVTITRSSCFIFVSFFKLFTPAWSKELIHIKRNTIIHVVRKASESSVPSVIKTPRFNADINDVNAEFFCKFCRFII